MDCYRHTDGSYKVNEVDLFSVCEDCIDSYSVNISEVKAIAKCMANYIITNWQNWAC